MKEDRFYSPAECRFNRRTTLWLIQNLGSLREGHWPTDASNYVDITSRSNKSRASFITPVEYAAEVESRLERCGLDGLILEALECWGKTVDSLGMYFGVPAWSIIKRARRALAYVASGVNRRWHNTPKRKGQSYQEFKKKGAKNAK